MKIEKKKYIAPVSYFVEVDPMSMLAMSASDDRIDTDEEDGGWAKEHVGGSWENIWGAQ